MRRVAVPLLFGLVGVAILVSMGFWQMQRLAWKQAILADIEARIAGAPDALPDQIDPERDKYAPVAVAGNLSAPELHVLVGAKDLGAGYRLIQPLEIGARRIMVDRGFISLDAKDRPRSLGQVRLIGNLHWPQEIDGYTPPPDLDQGIWFARDVPAMAAALDTEPVLLVVRQQEGGAPDGITPLPVGSAGISNDHLQYAITWFSLAFIWLAMTGYLLWRMRRPGGKIDVRSET